MKILEEYKSNDAKESFVDAYLDTLPIVFAPLYLVLLS